LGELENCFDLRGRKDTPYAIGVEAGKWGIDQITALDLAALKHEGAKRLEKPDLKRRVGGVTGDEFLEPPAYGGGPSLQGLDA
jgi:hypothetical protein